VRSLDDGFRLMVPGVFGPVGRMGTVTRFTG